MSYNTEPPYKYLASVNQRVGKTGIKFGRRANYPPGTRVVKNAKWIMYPNEAGDGYQLGLGRYNRYRKRPIRRRGTYIRESVYAPKITNYRRTTRRRAPVRRRKAAKKRRAPARRYRTGRGGFWDTLKSIGSDVGNTLLQAGAGLAKDLVAKKMGGLGRYSMVGGVPTLSGVGRYSMQGGVPVFTGTGQYGGGAAQAAVNGTHHVSNGDSALTEGSVMKQVIPSIVNAGEGEVVISHREYIADILSAGNAFSLVANLQINPGLDAKDGGAFPWLSGIAKHFQQYRFEGLAFEFVSTSGVQGTSQALGEVIMSTNYNVNDPQPANKQQMLSQAFAVSKVPAADFTHPIECDPKVTVGNGKLYVRGGPIETDNISDPRFYDMCETNIATQGQTLPASGDHITLGELWVTYQVSLYKPQIPSVSRQNTYENAAYVAYIGTVANPMVTNITGTDLFGLSTTSDVKEYDNIGMSLFSDGDPTGSNNTRSIYVKPGTYGRFRLEAIYQLRSVTGNRMNSAATLAIDPSTDPLTIGVNKASTTILPFVHNSAAITNVALDGFRAAAAQNQDLEVGSSVVTMFDLSINTLEKLPGDDTLITFKAEGTSLSSWFDGQQGLWAFRVVQIDPQELDAFDVLNNPIATI
jgi:hypothetical protein